MCHTVTCVVPLPGLGPTHPGPALGTPKSNPLLVTPKYIYPLTPNPRPSPTHVALHSSSPRRPIAYTH